jgi:acetyl-CoA synthetase (ADP-forming)/acetyltransferase
VTVEYDGEKTDFSRLFQPRTVAHVGASAKRAAGRFNFTEYLLNMGFPGRIFPVNPKYQEMFDLTCYPSLSAIPEEVDLAILAVPAASCVDLLREVPPGKLRFVVIHTSGFGEIDKRDLEAELLELARTKGFRVVGPNCMGVYSQPGRIGFWRDQWEIVNTPGAVGFASQSGGHAVNAVMRGMDSGIHFNKVISLGNQLDVSINEIVEFMGHDETIGVMGLYVEGIRDGRRFLELARQITPRKPIIVWKGGTTEDGKRAVLSHTGAMAGDEQVFAAAMRQAGVLVVDNMHQMIRLLRLLQPPFRLPGGGLGIFSPGGGNTVNVSDLFSAQPSLRLPRLGPDTMERLSSLLPEENVDVKNPVDPGAVGFQVMDKLVEAVAAEGQIDAILVLLTADYLSNIKSEENRLLAVETISTTISRLTRKIGKPIYILLRQERQNHEDYDRYRRLMVTKFIEKDIPWVDGSFKNAAEVFGQLADYSQHVARWKERAT